MSEISNWGIIGHEWAVELLRRAVEQDDLSHAYLFTGPAGVGKATLARALARARLCQDETTRPCGSCRACHLVESGNHPDLHWIEPETEAGRLAISQVRELSQQLSLTPAFGRHRLAVLCDFDRATPPAANALLKTLEEPPSYVTLVLLALDADALLPTIVSRCQVVPLRPLPSHQVQQGLVERWQVEPEHASLLAHLCGGKIGQAVTAASDPDLLQQRARRIADLERLLGGSLIERFQYAGQLARSPKEAEETLKTWSGWWRDVMLIAAGSDGTLTNPDMAAQLYRHAQALGAARAAGLAQVTWEAASLLQRNANPQLTLEVLIAFDLPRL